MQIYWFTFLFWSICLEGLGRKYLPGVPSMAFYVLKDFVLLYGFIKYPPAPLVRQTANKLYGGFEVFWLAAFGWTLIEIVNPEQSNKALGILGLRAYWLWWLAPITVAGALQRPAVKRLAIYVLLFTAVGICLFAVLQFASSPSSSVNLYSVVEGTEVYADMATVHSTGRARVSSTFSFLSGFVAFTVLIPAILLSIGMGTEDKKLRRFALGVTSLSAAVLPMSGSRGAMMFGAAVLLLTAWTAGLFFTKVGRRVMIGAVAGVALAVTAFPDAFEGVQSRFDDVEESSNRILDALQFLPPVAIAVNNFPIAGIGTGMQQNARIPLGEPLGEFNSEGEPGRYLIELGLVGYLLVWTAKLGLVVALLRAYAILKRARRLASAGAALSYAFLAQLGNLVFDHVWQALFFLGCGFILAEVVAVQRAQVVAPAGEVPPSRPLALPSRSAPGEG